MNALVKGFDLSVRGTMQSHKVKIRHGGSLRCYVYIPHNVSEHSPLLVTVHGISRNAKEQMEKYRLWAEKKGVILMAPKFSKQKFPGYQRLAIKDVSEESREKYIRADLALVDALDYLRFQLGIKTEKFYMFGFSGGAQFAHRFALFYPSRILGLVLGAAGWYTDIHENRRFPYGLGALTGETHMQAKLKEFLTIPVSVAVGCWDIYADTSLRTSSKINRKQGASRFDRGRNWVKSLQLEAINMKLPPLAEFYPLKSCGHCFTDAIELGCLDKIVFSKITGSVENLFIL